MSLTEFAAHIGIDWAHHKHYWQMAVPGLPQREHGQLEHTPQAIDLWAAQLRTRFPDRALAVCLEQSRGPLVYQLAKYDHLVLFPAHPATVASYRQAFFPSGSKGDPGDAALLLEILIHHPEHLRRLEPDTAETRLLQMLAEHRRLLVDERTRESNRLTAALKMYFPQSLDWLDNIDAPMSCAFLERWPTLQQLQRAHQQTVADFFREHHSRSEKRIQERLEAIRQAVPAVHDPALLRAGTAATRSLVALLRTLNDQVQALDREIAELVSSHPDAYLFAHLPGAGPALMPRLIVAFGTRRDRFASAGELAAYSGIAPVTRQSGHSLSIHFRHACPQFLRQTFHEFAAHSKAKSIWARTFYDGQRNSGKRHHAAVRALAFKWIRVLFRCWKDHTPYDEDRYLRALCDRNSIPVSTDPAE